MSAFKSAFIETPIGLMMAIADHTYLHALTFCHENTSLNSWKEGEIASGKTDPILSIEHELKSYFSGTLKTFKTPYQVAGTPFQKRAWDVLQTIPFGETRSYLEQAQSLGNPKAFRAVANANGVNQHAIMIPCHRIIQHNGALGGYSAGIEKKKWLLEHELGQRRGCPNL